MRFSTIFTVLAAGAMAFAGAVPEIVAKRSITDVQNTVADLSHKIDTITPKFGNCFDSTCSNEIVLEIVAAVDACTASLGPLSGGTATTALVTVVADVVTKITVSLDNHRAQCGSNCPGLLDIYAKVDVSLSLFLQVVIRLSLLLVVLISPLLLTLVVTLRGLGLTAVLNILLLI